MDRCVWSLTQSSSAPTTSQTVDAGQLTVGHCTKPPCSSQSKEVEGFNKLSFEEHDFPGFKTEDGVATTGDFQAAWFRDPDGNILCIHS